MAAVVPRYLHFVAKFPTVTALAAADEEQVLKAWEGLGYYRRARHLHAAAKRLVADHKGKLSDDPAVWAKLPGVGRYILGAVMSQAFDRRMPIVEANSLRVLARLFGHTGDARTAAGRKWVWAAAEALLPRRRPGDFNQALMELGALVCTPTAPKCGDCPMASSCLANRDGRQEAIPPRKLGKKLIEVNEVAVVIRRGSKVLLCRRPADSDRWQNMWEVPHAQVRAGETRDEAAARIARELAGFDVETVEGVATIKHTVTRYAITMTCVEARQRGGSFASGFYAAARWLTPAETAAFPLSSPQRKLMAELSAIASGE